MIPQPDQMKAWFAYVIAGGMIFGGMAMLYLTRLDPPESDVAGLRLLLSGFIGSAMMFVFNRETQTGTARAAERAVAQGASSQPTVTTTSGPPAATTVTPAPLTGGPST